MIVFCDTSALLRRYVDAPGRDLVVESMGDVGPWCASALARSEVQLALGRMAGSRPQLDSLWAAFRADWDAIASVPVDDRCLAHAVELGATFGVSTIDAIHLAAADRLPRPARFLTFSRHQLPGAAALGFDVVAPLA